MSEVQIGFPIFEENKKENKNLFICEGKGVHAKGEYSEDGLIVFKGSQARAGSIKGLGLKIRQKLIEQKILKLESDVYVFKEDYIFNSPSLAANFILARGANGWKEWKDRNGETLDARFRQK